MSGVFDAIGNVVSGVADAVSSVAAPIAKIALPAVASFFGGPIAGALTGGALTAAQGGNPFPGLALNLATSGAFSSPDLSGDVANNPAFSNVNATDFSNPVNAQISELANPNPVFDQFGNPLPATVASQVNPAGITFDAFGNPLPQGVLATDQFGNPLPVTDAFGNPIPSGAIQTDQQGNPIPNQDFSSFLSGNFGSPDVTNTIGSSGLGSSFLSSLSSGLKSFLGLSGLDTNQILSKVGSTVGSTAPGILALAYANRQPGFDPSQLQGIFNQVDPNAVTSSAIDPLQRNIAAGYGDLLQSQARRGIRGSSFGDTDIANYLSLTGTALSDAASRARFNALGLQGDLASRIAALTGQAQAAKNQLFGRAFDILGRGLNPRGYGGLTLTA